MTDIQDILNQLDGVKGHNGQWSARCPAHDDKKASLSVSVGQDGRILFNCHTGCSVETITAAMGLNMKDLFTNKPQPDRPQIVERYTYPNGAQKLRKSDKTFVWRRPDGKGGWIYNRQGIKHCLYVAGKIAGAVFICEGEKDANNLHELGFDAVSGEDGAGPGKWRKEYTEQLKDCAVCIFQDNDDVGREYAQETAASLAGVASSIQVFDLHTVWQEIPEHGDISDLIAHFGAVKAGEMIAELIKTTPQWKPNDKISLRREAKPATEFTDEKQEFVWVPYIPMGEYTVLMADGGTGKTYFCCKVAADISTGNPLPSEFHTEKTEPRNVLIISAEDRGGVLKRRLKAAGADLRRVFILDCTASEGMNFDDGLDEFKNTIKAYSAELVIIDPWHAFLGERVDINRVNAVRPVFHKVANMAKDCHCGIILVSHVNKKAQGDNANNAATGSTDFINAGRSALRVIFNDADENGRIVVHTKTNHEALGKSIKFRITSNSVTWDGFSSIDKATLEKAARQRKTVFELAEKTKAENSSNEALVSALTAEVNPFSPVRLSYDDLKDKYGDLIFGGTAQPKKALDAVKPLLEEKGIFIKTGIHVKRDQKSVNGFLIQAMDVDINEAQEEIAG